jgi:hypothetical protein
MKADTQCEAELWMLDRRYTRKGQDISTWTFFDVMQFISAAGYNHLWLFLNDHPNELPSLLKLVRLANLTKAELQAMFPNEKKSLSRIKLYQIARKQLCG